MKPEHELLLLCGRVRMSAENATRAGVLLGGGMDWNTLCRAALGHKVMPLLYRNLDLLDWKGVPEGSWKDLRDQFLRNTQHNLRLTAELLRVLKLFDAHQIRVLPYKGPVLTISIYGDLGLRQFSDLDVLVHKRDVLRSQEVLLSQGYRSRWRLSRLQMAATLRSQCHHQLIHEDSKTLLELHWAVTPEHFSCPVNFEHLWKRAVAASLGHQDIRVPCPEDLLLLLCIHGAKHLWERLGWVCDVAELVRTYPEMDWDWVVQQGGTLGARRVLFLGLEMARDILGTELPPEVLRGIHADRAVTALSAKLKVRISQGVFGSFGMFETLPFYFWMRERWRDKYGTCSATV